VFVGPLKHGLQSALTIVSLFFILFIVLSPFVVTPSFSTDSRHILYNVISRSDLSFPVVLTINSLVLLLGAFLISVFTIRNEIVEKTNYIPAFLYIFFSALTMSKGWLHPSLFANIFLLLSLNTLTDTYREDNALSRIFNAAIYCCIAFFFYLNYSILILLFFISLVMLRSFSWREWIISLMGFMAPLFIYACLGYLLNFDYIDLFKNILGLFSFFQKPLLSEYFYPLFITLIILILLTILKHFTQGLGSKIKTQKGLGIIYWFLLLSFINFFSQRNYHYFPLVASIIPLSILFSDYFYNIKQLKIANTLFFLLLAAGSLLIFMKLGII
jgi:hypothetical protein